MTDDASGDLASALRRPAPRAARALLGTVLACAHDDVEVAVRIVEVEAYGPDDPASHTFRGRTPRNATMFGPTGHLYVYRSHGIHLCANVVCGPPGTGAAVLLRGGEVVAGRAVAVRRRGGRDGDDWLAAGPGRLAQALGLRASDDGAALLDDDGPLRLVDRDRRPDAIRRGPRVGVTSAPDVPWRFWVDESRGVSRYRRSPRAPRPPATGSGRGDGAEADADA